jgi:hypothetical protein
VKWTKIQTRKISDERWIVALETADRNGDLGTLADLLHDEAPPDDVRELLADLLKHRRFSRPVRTSPNDMKLLDAARCVKMKFGKRPSERPDDFIKRIADERGVKEKQLRDVLGGEGKISKRLRRRS